MVHTLTMRNGVEIPMVGFGTAMDKSRLREALETALECGYRLIDTAHVYLNEKIVGEVLNKWLTLGKIKRSELFITTKLAPFMHEPELTSVAIQNSLQSLQVDYIDMFLIHVPCSYKPQLDLDLEENRIKCYKRELEIDLTPHIETWRVLERFYINGQIKAIGVSNFNSQQLTSLYKQAQIKPMYLQVECNIYQPQYELQRLCETLNIVMGAFSSILTNDHPIALKNTFELSPLKHPLIKELSKKYNKTPAQIILRQITQRNIAVIPRSSSTERIRENIDLFNFSLTMDEMNKFEEIKHRSRCRTFASFVTHPRYPFPEEIDGHIQ